jgi:Holliday junction resolvasome RuvABC endonuclease subunit
LARPRKTQKNAEKIIKKKEKMSENLLALDAASKKTGYAIYENDRVIKSGTWKLKEDTQFRTLRDNLIRTIENYKITYMVTEGIYRDEKKTNAFEVLNMCKGVITEVAQRYDISLYDNLNPLRVKTHMWDYNYPRHKALTHQEHKQRMINAVKRLGYTLEKENADDEADAIGLLITYAEMFRIPIIHPNQQQ